MKKAALALLLLSLAPVLAQQAPQLEVETVRSDAQRLALDVETINSEVGWFPAGSRPQDYSFGVGTTQGMTRPLAFRIQAKSGASRGGNDFGTLMRYAPVTAWRGKRLRLSARMKSENAAWLCLWLRVDPADRGSRPLAFYNMADRPVRGSTDWKRYEAVMDVPDGAAGLAFGFFLAQGRGLGWAEDFHVEEVGREVPVTVMP